MMPPDEARTIALDWAHTFHPDATVDLEPFELGYVVSRSLPEFADSAEPVYDVRVTMVIDGATGEVTPCPALPTSAIARLFQARHHARERFSAPLHGLLTIAGWRPARDLGLIVDGWWSRNGPAGGQLPAAVRAVVAEFGGITLRPLGLSLAPYPTGEAVRILATSAGPAVVVGSLRESAVAVDNHGAVYLSDNDGPPQRIAGNFDAALAHLTGLAP
jgi:hypothetical protein